MNHIFIINPESGKRKGLYAGQVIEDYLRNKKINYKVHYTGHKNEALEIANQYKDSDNIIYSVGGDGTLNEIVNSLAKSDATLSIIPIGSGNDFYKSFKSFEGDYIDLGLVNDRYFINVASIGLDAEIANYANILKEKKLPNKLVYILSLIKNYLIFDSITVEKNNLKSEKILLAICNGSFYGGGFKIAPYASIDDGWFDIYDVNKLNKIKTLKLLSKLLKGTHTEDENVTYYRSDGIFIESEITLLCNIDGEIIEGREFNISIEQEAIKVLKHDDLGINDLLKSKKLIK